MGDDEQEWDPESYARNARFVSDLGMPVVELLAPRRGERVLDLGCGDGALTLKLVEMGCTVIGIDSSEAQVGAARSLGLDARRGDATALDFHGEFDAVFSNAALHWVHDAVAVIDGARRALVPGGRFVAELGGRGCVAKIVAALSAELERRGFDAVAANPWYFPGDDVYRALLERAGFEVEYIALIDRPTPLPGDVVGWLETFAQGFLAAVPAEDRTDYLEAVRSHLSHDLCDAGGRWTADYVRLRFAARLPAS